AAVEHLDPAGVGELQPHGRRARRRLDLDRAAAVHAEGPLGDVEVVGAHVGQPAAGVLAVVAPGREVAVDAPGAQRLAVLTPRRRPQPQVRVGPLRHRLAGQVARDRRAADADADGLHLAQEAAADQLAGQPEPAAELAALLAAGLEHDLRLPGLVGDAPA